MTYGDPSRPVPDVKWEGLTDDETVALEQLLLRVKIEEEEFNKTGLCCRYQPLQNRTDLLASPLLSMSAAIAHGTLSVRL